MTLIEKLELLFSEYVRKTSPKYGVAVMDFGPYPGATQATVEVFTGVTRSRSFREGCVSATINPTITVEVEGSPGHTEDDHIAHAPFISLMCKTPRQDGSFTTIASAQYAMCGRYSFIYRVSI
jgi:hypothetical protein